MEVPDIASNLSVLPSQENIKQARSKLHGSLPGKGIGVESAVDHIRQELELGLNQQSKSPHYYGFVTGGKTPAANAGDHLATEFDQNVCVHLPNDTIATDVEDRALHMLCELLNFDPNDWQHRTFSTGATASNVAGLACGREFVIREAAAVNNKDISIGEHGVHNAMRTANIDEIQILTTVPHSSLRKAASVVGLGRASLKEVGREESPHRFNMQALKAALEKPKVASIVAVSCAEVNTGLFATTGEEMRQIRQLCDLYGAWLHVDAAFGLLARVLPHSNGYETIVEGVDGIELADSITGDAHKLLNVPYDCGIFLSRHLSIGISVFQNTNAAYLNAAPVETNGSAERQIPSPLNIGLENSRRFRALPVYSTLIAYGREGYRDMMERQIRLAREIAQYIFNHPEFELLPQGCGESSIYIIVLFRAKGEKLNDVLVQKINASRKIYVSGTQWEGKPAARFAVANWQVDGKLDMPVIQEVLEGVLSHQ